MKRLRPFFSYYGSKYRLAPSYPAPLHSTIVEPFAGSAAYACLHYSRKVVLYESNEPVNLLWRFLIRARSSEIRRIPLLANDQTIDDLHGVCQEAKYLVGFWLNKGTAHLHYRPGAWMRTGKYKNQFWGESIRERVASQIERIRHWRVGGDHYLDAPVGGRKTWFIDPPYQGPKGRLYYGRNIDYKMLGVWCRILRGQVIVCEAEGANWLQFDSFAKTRGTGLGVSHEAVWIGGQA